MKKIIMIITGLALLSASCTLLAGNGDKKSINDINYLNKITAIENKNAVEAFSVLENKTFHTISKTISKLKSQSIKINNTLVNHKAEKINSLINNMVLTIDKSTHQNYFSYHKNIAILEFAESHNNCSKIAVHKTIYRLLISIADNYCSSVSQTLFSGMSIYRTTRKSHKIAWFYFSEFKTENRFEQFYYRVISGKPWSVNACNNLFLPCSITSKQQTLLSQLSDCFHKNHYKATATYFKKNKFSFIQSFHVRSFI